MEDGKLKKIVLLVLFYSLFINLFANLDKVIDQTDVSELNSLSIRFYNEWKQKHDEALVKAVQRNIPLIIEHDKGFMELSHFDEFDHPIYHILHNSNAAITISTDHVHPGGIAGLNLTGNGILIRQWDGGAVRGTHQELTGRTTNGDGSTLNLNSFHSTHVGGTIIASGVQLAAKGMAYDANLKFFEWTNDTSEMATEAGLGMLLSNHSYGYGRGWVWTGSTWDWSGQTSPGEDWNFGHYNDNSQDFDEIAYDAPFYLIVESAGNDRGDGPGSDPQHPDADGPYDCLADMAASKNVLTVAAVEDMTSTYSHPSDVVMSTFSSWGPCDDGRIKPDISANGTYLYSTYDTNDTAYDLISGTSMAAPSVTGSLALIQEHYEETKGTGLFLRSSTLKALTLHCADEAGSNDGPDYAFGWGLMNTERMAQYISNDGIDVRIQEITLANSGTYQITLPSLGTEPFKVTLCWTDPEGTPVALSLDPSDPMLINDLDIRITKDASTYYPWKLDGTNPGNGATNSGDNSIDNVEQVFIENPAVDNYTITVTHKGTLVDDAGSTSPQQFGLIISGIGSMIPDITASPASFDQTLGLNGAAQQTLTISNDGESGSELTYNVIIESNTRSLNSNLQCKAYQIKEKIAKGRNITSEEYNILKEFENMKTAGSPTTGRASTTCYPDNATYWSGTTTDANKTDISEARVYGGNNAESGWIKFDVSAIPDGSAINSIDFHFYVNDTNWPYWSSTPISNDPVTTSASTLYEDIIAEEILGFYNQQNENSGYDIGWKNLTLGGGANTDLFNQLINDWFAIGISSRDSNPIYYLEIDGWNQNNIPYIIVNYTLNIPILELTSPNGYELWAIGSTRNINWDHSGAPLTNIELELSTNNGGAYSEIIASTDNDGTYEWTVAGIASEQCLIRVSDPDASSTNDVSNAVFRIYDTVDWLTIDQDNGSLDQSSSDNLTLTFDSSGLSAGTYNANLEISSNDPDEPIVTIPVELTVVDNISHGSGNNGDGTSPAYIFMPITNIDGYSVDPDVIIDPVDPSELGMAIPIIVNITVTDQIQSPYSVPNENNVVISYAVEVIGNIEDIILEITLSFSGLAGLEYIHWLNGSTWEIPGGLSWDYPSGTVSFNITLADTRNGSTEIILGSDNPLPVTLSTFTAQYINNTSIIAWTTQSEMDNLGWNIYRSPSQNMGQALQLNTELIPGAGTTTQPTNYQFIDDDIYQIPGYTYWYSIESIDLSGTSCSYGSVSCEIPGDGDDLETPAIPIEYGLMQNYPNPFNPNTLISFNLKDNEFVILKIYDIKGNFIKTIVNEQLPSGPHEYFWDSKNCDGKQMSSGIYIYLMEAGSYSSTKKMILLK